MTGEGGGPRRGDVAGPEGILVVDKPVGPTSHDIVALVRRLAGTRRVGHGGTLDPFASGVLPLYLGRATRVAEFHIAARKAYRATVCFGASSTTDDLEGELTAATGPAPRREDVEAALGGFLGTLRQRPPAFSARKIGGRRAYAIARAGAKPEIPARDVTFHRLVLVGWDDREAGAPLAIVEVECSAGTYVRALARDLGEAVGSAGHLVALVRTASGPFTLADAHPLERVRSAAAEGRLPELLRPVGTGLDELPAVTLDAGDLAAVLHGGFVRVPAAEGPTGEARVRVLDGDGRLVAIARRSGGRLAPDKVLADLPPAVRTPSPQADPVTPIETAPESADA